MLAVSNVVNSASQISPTTSVIVTKTTASDDDNRPCGNGRSAVRSIRPSRNRSSHWLAAQELAATSSVPNKACATAQVGCRHEATQAAAATATSTISAILGLVNSTYAVARASNGTLRAGAARRVVLMQ